MDIDKEELDFQLSPSKTAKDALATLRAHTKRTTAALNNPRYRVGRDLTYGSAPRQRLDVISPLGDGPFPCVVVIHGGFWQEGSKAVAGFAVDAFANKGWATALIGYTLAPDASLTEIVNEVGNALSFLAEQSGSLDLDSTKLVLVGHSAGGQLAAAMIAGKAGPEVARMVSGAVLVSGVFDLAPIAASYVNDLVGMDREEIRHLSVLETPPKSDVPVHVLVGSDESDAFRGQSDALALHWGPHITRLSKLNAPGRDHFDVLDELADESSPSFEQLRAMLS